MDSIHIKQINMIIFRELISAIEEKKMRSVGRGGDNFKVNKKGLTEMMIFEQS